MSHGPREDHQDGGASPLMTKTAPAATKKHVRLEIKDPNRFPSELTLASSVGECETGEAGENENGRGSWGGKMEFIFTCIGYAVGLGNVWRFPYLCYTNGGGAFLLPYVIMLILVGLPLFFMELAFGQYASLGPIAIWKINPVFKGLGYAMVSISWLIAIYYNVIIAHVMMFLFASFRAVVSGLPWISCDNYWNTDACIQPLYVNQLNDTEAGNETLGDVTTMAATTVGTVINNITRMKTPAEEYYTNYILEQSSGIDEPGEMSWKLPLCLLLAWMIVLICLIRGIQSLGKVVYFTAIFPYIMLTILLIRGLTLPGAWLGIKFYLTPDFGRLLDSRVWCDAATQIFYSLSACTGGLIAMSSYNKFDNNCYRDALIVSLVNCATSIYAGFVIFAILGFMALEKGVPVSEVAAGGPGLAFVVYPEAISRMPVPVMWAIFFFFMMATLGFGSQFSIVECVLSAFTDEFPNYLRGSWRPYVFRVGVILFTFLLGLPMVTSGGIYLLNLVDYSVSGFPLLVVGALEIIALNWIYGFSRFSEDIYTMLGRRLNIYWKACWLVLSPLVIGITITFNMIYYKPPSMDGLPYPAWAQTLSWLITFFPMAIIAAYFLFEYCRRGGFVLMWKNMQPDADWGPASCNKPSVLNTEIPLTPKEFEHQHFTFDGYEYRKVLCSHCNDNSVQIRIDTWADQGDNTSISMGSDEVLGSCEHVAQDKDISLEKLPLNGSVSPNAICAERVILLNDPKPRRQTEGKVHINDLREKFFSESMEDKNRKASETSHTESDEIATVTV